MFELNIEELKFGDLILTANDRFISRRVRKKLSSDYSHALIYIGNGMAFESLTSGVKRTNVNSMFFSNSIKAVYRLNEDLSIDSQNKILDYLTSQIGAPYAFNEARLSAVENKELIRKEATSMQFCSRLVARAYSKAGVFISDNVDFANPKDLQSQFSILVHQATRLAKGNRKSDSHDDMLYAPEIILGKLTRLAAEISRKNHIPGDYGITEISRLDPSEKRNQYFKRKVSDLSTWVDNVGVKEGYFLNKLRRQPELSKNDLVETLLNGYSEDLRISNYLIEDSKLKFSKFEFSEIYRSLHHVFIWLLNFNFVRNLDLLRWVVENDKQGILDKLYTPTEQCLITKALLTIELDIAGGESHTSLTSIIEKCAKNDDLDKFAFKKISLLSQQELKLIFSKSSQGATSEEIMNGCNIGYCLALTAHNKDSSRTSRLMIDLLSSLSVEFTNDHLSNLANAHLIRNTSRKNYIENLEM